MNYKQDLPPSGGYGKIPFKRNIPVRGPSGYHIIAMSAILGYAGLKTFRANKLVFREEVRENKEAEMALLPLLEAEKDRNILRNYKEAMESEALNIIGTGYDPDHVVGGKDLFNIERWREPPVPKTYSFIPTAIQFWFDHWQNPSIPGP